MPIRPSPSSIPDAPAFRIAPLALHTSLRRSFGVVEDHAQRMAGTRAQSTDAVAHVDAVDAAYALHGSVSDREDHGLSTLERHDLRSRLLARALLGEDELATGEIVVGPREQEGGLQRENMLAIDVLVQAVVVARAVLQQQ